MVWVTENVIKNYLEKFDLDVKKTGDARWIDQKCTPDILSFIADCIISFFNDANRCNRKFTSMDIWHSDYAVSNVQNIFKKPNPNSSAPRNEYDKFFQQPMKLLSYAHILRETKINKRNFYEIDNLELLEYISFREINALKFLQIYIEKVLKDSNLYYVFETFFSAQTASEYENLKNTFRIFTQTHTKINGDLECGRIFTKIINPLAYKYNSLGTEKGHISRNIITLDMLMYNRDNFRDIYLNKPKGITRKEYCLTHNISYNEKYGAYSSAKAKKYLRLFNDTFRGGISEVDYDTIKNPAIQMHHIFPESNFPELEGYLENLIALTPDQHFINAHPMGNTSVVDKHYQIKCLIAKIKSIKENLNNIDQDNIYDFKKFLYVLDVGYNTNIFEKFDFYQLDEIIKNIECI